MKRISVLLMLMLLVVAGQAQMRAKRLKPYLSTTTYCVPGMTPYVENAIAFECRSATYKEFAPGKFKATVEITTVFRKGEETTFSKIALDSPVVTDTAKLDGAFIGQQRFSLPNGEYQMEISVSDLNSGQALLPETATVEVNFPEGNPALSDILLFDSYTKADKPSECTKSGYDFLPRVYPFYGPKDDKLNFYVEMYNSDKLYDEGKYLVSYYIESCESSSLMKSFFFRKSFEVKNVNTLINSININELPSGNYYLVVEMRDRSNELICSNSCFFQRSNPSVGYDFSDLAGLSINNTFVSEITNIDTLRRYISYLEPICSENERDYSINLVKTNDKLTMQQFLYNFWATRNPLNPKAGFEEYLAAVNRVNMSFKCLRTPGYRTDRGYVFLKYGQPDKIMQSPNEPGAYPYEIWHYYVVANQRNRRFVFMSKDDSTNDYQLIHSDMIGEVKNPAWQREIYSRIYGQGDEFFQGVDETEYQKGWGSRAGEYYDNPR